MSENLDDSRTFFRGELAERFSEPQKGVLEAKVGVGTSIEEESGKEKCQVM